MGSEWSHSARVNTVCLGDVCAAASVCVVSDLERLDFIWKRDVF